MNSLTARVRKLFEHRRFNLIAFVIIAATVLIAYSNTLNSSFHFDDNPTIVENPAIKRLTADNLMILLNSSRPVVSLSLMLNYQLGGLNVVGYHIFNIGCHIITGFLVYLFIVWTLNMPPLVTRFGDRARRMGLFGALLFALHPVQTESVTYIITRSEILAALFYLATFLLFIRFVKSGKFSYVLAASVTSLLSMGSKQWAVTLPAMLMLYDFLFLSDRKIKPVLSRWLSYVLIALSWIQIYHTTPLASPGGNASFGFTVHTTTGITTWTYFLTSCNVIWTYIRLLVLPIHQNLDYDYPVAKTLLEFPTLLSFLGHAAVIAAAFILYKKKNALLLPFCVAFFYITLSPTQSIVPIVDLIFEHRVYLPSVGFFFAFVVAYEEVFEWLGNRKGSKPVIAAAGNSAGA
jgi:hypothetical protein